MLTRQEETNLAQMAAIGVGSGLPRASELDKLNK